MAQLCREHKLKEPVVTRWRAVLRDRAELRFSTEPEQDGHLERIAALARLVGRLTMELDLAPNASQRWGARGTSSGS
jgi:hypothetical protein